MLYQARGIRDSSRTNLVCRGSATTRAMGTLPRLPEPRRDVPPGEREPSARDDPSATDVASCSQDAIPRWPAPDRPAHRAGGPRRRDVARCRGDPSSACAPFHGTPCRATLPGRAPSRGRPEACPGLPSRAPWSGWAWAGMEAGVARGRAGVALGEVGLAGLCTTAIGAWVATAVGCVTTGAGGTGGRLCRGNGRRRDGWSGRLVLTRILGLRVGPAGVGFTAGAVADGVGLAALGAVGVVVANAVPAVGTAPTSGVGAGAERPYPSATVARTRLTTPRASTSRRRCVPLTWILGSPKATGGRRPAAPSRRW